MAFGSVPIPVTDESQDRPFARMDQEAKAALRIAISFALTWPASVQRCGRSLSGREATVTAT